MAWIVDSVDLREVGGDVGNVTVTWDTGGADQYTHSGAAETTVNGANAFMVVAEAAKDRFLALRAAGLVKVGQLQTIIDT